ncbi:MAG: hypothetical protein RR228_04185 [Bacilli bacterium]
MIFNYGLKENKVNLDKVIIDSSIEFAALTGAYISGKGDYVNLFEPSASMVEKQKIGCILGSVGEISGEVPYTSFYARKSYINNNKNIIKKFNKALNKALEYTMNNNEQTLAKDIKKQFIDTNILDLEIIIKRYKDADSWWKNTYISKASFNRLQNIMKYNNVLEKETEYNILVNNEFN